MVSGEAVNFVQSVYLERYRCSSHLLWANFTMPRSINGQVTSPSSWPLLTGLMWVRLPSEVPILICACNSEAEYRTFNAGVEISKFSVRTNLYALVIQRQNTILLIWGSRFRNSPSAPIYNKQTKGNYYGYYPTFKWR